MDVGGWLRGLGLGQYEEKFRDNKIDADLLPRLTVDDLKDIGVSVVGDRRRLLDAIAILAGTSPPAEVPATAMKSAPAQGLQASAERRTDAPRNATRSARDLTPNLIELGRGLERQRCATSERNGSCPFTPPSTIRSTFNAIFFPATRSALSEAKRCRTGGRRLRPKFARADFRSAKAKFS